MCAAERKEHWSLGCEERAEVVEYFDFGCSANLKELTSVSKCCCSDLILCAESSILGQLPVF